MKTIKFSSHPIIVTGADVDSDGQYAGGILFSLRTVTDLPGDEPDTICLFDRDEFVTVEYVDEDYVKVISTYRLPLSRGFEVTTTERYVAGPVRIDCAIPNFG